MTNESVGVVTRSRKLAASSSTNSQHIESMDSTGKDKLPTVIPVFENTETSAVGASGTAEVPSVAPAVDTKQMFETLMV